MKQASRFLLAGLLLLTACGFSPIYGAKGNKSAPVANALSQIAIENIPDENGQKLRNRLIDRMYFHGRPKTPSAKLIISLSEREVSLGIKKDATASLSELTLSADYRLVDKDDQPLLSSSARSIVLYSQLDAQYGTLAAQRNAYDRALTELGEQIVNRLGVYYAETPHAGKPARPAAETSEELGSNKDGWALGRALVE